MNTTNANVPIVARRPVLRWAVLIGGIAVGFATGLLTEANPQFFFGTGDGSAGYYTDRQAR
jgi:hypothetical protein